MKETSGGRCGSNAAGNGSHKTLNLSHTVEYVEARSEYIDCTVHEGIKITGNCYRYIVLCVTVVNESMLMLKYACVKELCRGEQVN